MGGMEVSMGKRVCLPLILIAVLLSACQAPNDPAMRSGNSERVSIGAALITSGQDVNENITDKGIWDGLLLAREKLGVVSGYIIPEENTESGFTKVFLKCKNDGHNFLWLSKSEVWSKVLDTSDKYGEITFAVIGMANPDEGKYKNFIGITFNEGEIAFISGYAAGLLSGGKSVGFIGANEDDAGSMYAFMSGAKKAGTDFIAEFANGGDYAKLAENMFGKGVYIIYTAGEEGAAGVLEAAEAQDGYVIGPADNKRCLMNVERRIDRAVLAVMEDYLAGGTANNYSLGVRQGFIRYKFPEGFDVEIKEKITAVENQIAAKEITVPYNQKTYEDF